MGVEIIMKIEFLSLVDGVGVARFNAELNVMEFEHIHLPVLKNAIKMYIAVRFGNVNLEKQKFYSGKAIMALNEYNRQDELNKRMEEYRWKAIGL
jgi:hypothetical protein